MIENKFELDFDLFDGTDIEVESHIKVGEKDFNMMITLPQNSIKDIKIKNGGIGYNEYESTIWTLTREPHEFQFDLEDSGIDYKNVNSFQMFVMLNSSKKILSILENLSFLFGKNILLCYQFDSKEVLVDKNKEEDKEKYKNIILGKVESDNKRVPYFISEDKNFMLNEITIDDIKYILKKILYLKTPKIRKPKTEEAKKLIKRQAKMRMKNKVKYNIISIMRALVCSPNCGETHNTIANLSPHQIYGIYYTIEKIKNFDNTVQGLYAGIIKKEDINFNEINWVNEL